MIEYQGLYFDENGDRLSIDIVRAISLCFKANLPLDYQDFLINVNGGIPKKNIIKINSKYYDNEVVVNRFFGITARNNNNLLEYLDIIEEFDGIIPDGAIPIAVDCYGNFFFLALRDSSIREKVYYWDHDYIYHAKSDYNPKYPIVISNNFKEFLLMLSE